MSSSGKFLARNGVGRRRGKVRVPSITLAHGGGGQAMHDLIDDVFVNAFDSEALDPLEDQARFSLANLATYGDRLAFTTDSYVVNPLDFPGGNIGKLAICGTVNDLAVGGAIPLYLSCAVIIEEGFARRDATPSRRDHGVRGSRGGRQDRDRRHQGRRAWSLRQTLHQHLRHRRHSRGDRTGLGQGATR